MTQPQVFTLMGPTAAGKTEMAIELYEHHGFELISVDSVLVYRGLDIGSAKPTAEQLARAPHALIDVREFWEPYSAGHFREDCATQIQRILRAGRKPLLVGGTQMYFKTLWNLNSDLPPANPTVRAQLRAQAQRIGWPALHQRLASLDPITAARLHPNHNTRIERALEVYELTGRALSEFHVEQQSNYQIHSLALVPSDRAWLHQRIEQRLNRMRDNGFIEEVEQLMGHPKFDPALPSMMSVGYRQAIEGIGAGQSIDQWMPKAVAATRQLAKRQLTWLRSWPGLVPLEAETAQTQDVLRAFADFI